MKKLYGRTVVYFNKKLVKFSNGTYGIRTGLFYPFYSFYTAHIPGGYRTVDLSHGWFDPEKAQKWGFISMDDAINGMKEMDKSIPKKYEIVKYQKNPRA